MNVQQLEFGLLAVLVGVWTSLALVKVATDRWNTIPPSPTMLSNVDLKRTNEEGILHVEAVPLVAALKRRRSCRSFDAKAAISLHELSEVLWSCDGISSSDPEPDDLGHGIAPRHTHASAGAIYPLHVYVLAERVQGLEPGAYKYIAQTGQLEGPMELPGSTPDSSLNNTIGRSKGSSKLAAAVGATLPHVVSSEEAIAGHQVWAHKAAALLVLCADQHKLEKRGGFYAKASADLCLVEVGMAAQSALLAVAAQEYLGACPIGAFDVEAVKHHLPGIGVGEKPVLMLAMGRPTSPEKLPPAASA